MEQLLGRVLRLPYAKKRKAEALNRAYAHVCGPSTAAVANQLTDRLVAMGFEEMEAASFVQVSQDDLFNDEQVRRPVAPPPQSEVEVSVSVAEILRAAMPEFVRAAPASSTSATSATSAVLEPAAPNVVTLTGLLPAAGIEAAVAAAPKKEREELVRLLERHQTRTLAALAPSQRGVLFGALPQLVVPVQGELLLLEPALLTELAEVRLATAPADLPDFALTEDDKPYLIDIARGQLRIEQDRTQYTLDLNAGNDAVRREDVIRELDRRVRRDDVLQPDMIAWLGRVLDGLLARGVELNYVARHINQLSEAVAKRMDALVKSQRTCVFQRSLVDGPEQVRLTDVHQFRFDASNYPARWLFNGRYNFEKHYYPRPGELDDDLMQEETACAIELDRMSQIERWVRNLERQPERAFWLPTSTDRFYPDFVAELKDGRFFVVEYKGGDRYSNDDSREKRDIGAVWAAASNGRCVFAMVTDAKTAGTSVAAQLRKAIGA